VALTTGVSSVRRNASARQAAEPGSPSAIAALAMSTRIGCGSPVSANERARVSTEGGRALVSLIVGSLRSASVPASIDPITIDLVQLDPELPLPSYAHEGDAGLDLYARQDASIPAAGGRLLMATGISIAIPLGFCGLVMPRSGLALKHGISVANTPGLIDSAYRGEIKVVVLNTDPDHDYVIHRGDRVAQLVIQRVTQVAWNIVEDLAGIDRGGGFGHTGR
jgi:dUTP pyrophosphatase